MGYFGEQQIDRNARTYASSKNCKHERSEKEYILGSSTGDRVCLDCGEVFYPEPKTKQKNLDK